MADERYYRINAIFDPAVFATLAMPWTPPASTGDDPGNMRERVLQTGRVGRFQPDVLGRRNKRTTSLVWVWTDGPVGQGWQYSTLGSDTTAAPPSVTRSGPVALTTTPQTAMPLELGPDDDLAINTGGVQTTCYTRVLDLDEEQLLLWKANGQCCGEDTPEPLQYLTLNAPGQLPTPVHDLVVFVNFDSGDIVLPVQTTVPDNRKITLIRIAQDSAAGPPRIVPFAVGDQVNGRTGVLNTEYNLLRRGDAVTYRHINGGWDYQRFVNNLNRIVSGAAIVNLAALQDGVQYIDNSGGGTMVLPSLATTAVGTRYAFRASALFPNVTLQPQIGDLINGQITAWLTGGGVAFVENTGAQWLALISREGPPIVTTAGAVINVSPWEGLAVIEASNAVAFVNLPGIATVNRNSKLLVINTGTGTVTIDGAGLDTINGSLTRTLTRGQATLITAESQWTAVGGGSPPVPIVTGAAATNLAPFVDGIQFVETTGAGGSTVTLPDGALVPIGAQVWHRNTSANAHVLAAFAGNTINGGASIPLAAGTQALASKRSATDWYAIQ